MSTISEGLLSGFKIAALQSELEQSRLERAEFEETAGHRMRLRALQEALGQSQLGYSQLQEQLGKLSLEQGNLQLGEFKAGAGSRKKKQDLELEGLGAELAQTRAQTGQAEAATRASLANVAQSEALTEQARAGTRVNTLQGVALERSLGQRAGQARGQLGLQDFALAAEKLLTSLNTKFKPGDPTHQMMTEEIAASAGEAQRELDQNNFTVAAAKADMLQNQATLLAEQALRGMDPMGLVDSAAGLGYPKEVLDRARSIVQAEVQSPREIDRQTMTGQTLIQMQKEVREARNAKFAQVNRLTAKSRLTSTEKAQLETAKKELEGLDNELASIEEGVTGRRRRNTSIESGTVGYLETLPDDIMSLTDEDIKELAAQIKARGNGDFSVSQIKAEIKRRRGR